MCTAIRSNVTPDAMLSLDLEFVMGDGSTTIMGWLDPRKGHLGGMDQSGACPMTGCNSDFRALHWVRHGRSLHFKRLAGFGTTAIVTSPDSELIIIDTINPVDGIMFIFGLPGP